MSFDVKRRGKAWRARVRIYNGPTVTRTFDTHLEAKEWAVITHGRLLAEHRTSHAAQDREPLTEPLRVGQTDTPPAPLDPFFNIPVETMLREYSINVLPSKASHTQELSRLKRLIGYFQDKTLGGISDEDIENYIQQRLNGTLGIGRGHLAGTSYLAKNQRKPKRTLRKEQNNEACEGRPPSTQSVRHEISLLRRAIKYAVVLRKIPTQAAAGLAYHPIMTCELPDKAPPRTRRFSDRELHKLLDAFQSVAARTASIFAACTSLRRSEVVSLRWDDVRLDERIVILRKPVRSKRQKTKTKQREVPLIPAAIKLLQALGPKASGLIWNLKPASLTQAFGRAAERAGVSDARLHDLRREAISRYVEIYGLGIEKIMNFSGHSDVKTLVTHYLQPQSRQIAASIAKLEADHQEVTFLPI